MSVSFANRQQPSSLSSIKHSKLLLKVGKCICSSVKLLANPPRFWTKTDLRKSLVSCILLKEKSSKPPRSEPRERACFHKGVETLTRFFVSWRGCRHIGPNEGTEILVLAGGVWTSQRCRHIGPNEGTEMILWMSE